MKIKIKVLNVADADAIIVSLSDNIKGNLLLLIDGGRASHASMVIDHLSKEAFELGKQAPDYIICTHFDSDHIGGLFKVVKHFKNLIGHVLIHKTSQTISPFLDSYSSNDVDSIFPSEDDAILSSDYQVALESLKQEVDFIDFVSSLNIPLSEPIAKLFSFKGWDDHIEILSPSYDYYKSLFPSHFDLKEIALTGSVDESDFDEVAILKKYKNPFDAFDKLKRSRVSAPNLNSVILRIKHGGKSFIFSGDASIESFQSINNYEEVLSEVFWFKVPHHGSKNNLSSQLINIIRPTYAVISGDKLVSEIMLLCFGHLGSEVNTTRGVEFLSYEFNLSE